MNPKYCISLELAKRLKESGVPQESEFYWTKSAKGHSIYTNPPKVEKPYLREKIVVPEYYYAFIYSAFHVGELGEILSRVEYDSMGFPCLQIIYDQSITKQWHTHYRNPPLNWGDNHSQEVGRHKNMAESMGLMLEYLYKEGLMG